MNDLKERERKLEGKINQLLGRLDSLPATSHTPASPQYGVSGPAAATTPASSTSNVVKETASAEDEFGEDDEIILLDEDDDDISLITEVPEKDDEIIEISDDQESELARNNFV